MRDRAPDLGAIAAIVQRLAVLLAAGVAPAAAWEYLRDGELAAAVAEACGGGASIPDAIVTAAAVHPVAREQVAWRGLATAWAVAADAGAPLAPTLREFAASLRDLAQAQREIAVALAAPTATARLVLALPVVGILFGVLLGFNTLGTLLTTPPGWMCLGMGSGLMFGASRWNRRLVARAQPRDVTPGLDFDLLAIAVSGEVRSIAPAPRLPPPRSAFRSMTAAVIRASPRPWSCSPGRGCLRRNCCAAKRPSGGAMHWRPCSLGRRLCRCA